MYICLSKLMEKLFQGGGKLMKEHTLNRLSSLVLYILGFLVLWEWLRPLEVISDVGNSYFFVFFIVLMLVIDLFTVKLIWKVILASFYMAVVSHSLYYDSHSLFGIGWLWLFIEDIISSIQELVQSNWHEVTNSFRTLLFFILLWMMTYLLRYWVIIRRRIFLFFLLSIVFIATLDTFTKYDGDWAIVRLFIFGIVLIGLLTFLRMLEKEKVFISIADTRFWLLPLSVFIVLATLIGFFSPKLAAKWPDPVPFFVSSSEKFVGSNSSVNKVGYGEDDSRLGGDFIPDNSLVFTARTDSKHYWFVESKNLYTGIGWESTNALGEIAIQNGGILLSSSPHELGMIESDVQSDFLNIHTKYKHLPYPSPIYNGRIISLSPSVEFTLDLETNRVNQAGGYLGSYEVQYHLPTYHIDDLRSATTEGINDFYSEAQVYKQVPASLPERVKELAESITENQTNTYDKVKAVEKYFDSSEFTYARTDVPYPKEDEDFVDQFLFETKRGYCDHFSTSMVVMLRALDIPARWVKGYSPGTFIKNEDGKSIYEITNNNAHSWVEVFFDGIGWVPFEPTKGYNLNTRIQYDFSNVSTDDTQNETSQQVEPESQIEEQNDSILEEDNGETEQAVGVSDTVKEYISENWTRYSFAAGVILVLIILAYLIRGKWLPYIWIVRFKRSTDEEAFTRAYGTLLKELNRFGVIRKSGQTLRDYAEAVDGYFSSNEMRELTAHYEKVMYGNGDAVAIWEQVKPLWVNVMKKTIT